MAHDVFISYSTKDKEVADAVCATLESRGVRCWIAPRDIVAGMEWSEAIIDALSSARVMVLVFSGNANESPQVKREVQRAFEKGVTVIPFRVENVAPSKALEYYIGPVHWLDAFPPPMEQHFQRLFETTRLILSAPGQTASGEAGSLETSLFSACPQCRRPVSKADLFCPNCRYPLAGAASPGAGSSASVVPGAPAVKPPVSPTPPVQTSVPTAVPPKQSPPVSPPVQGKGSAPVPGAPPPAQAGTAWRPASAPVQTAPPKRSSATGWVLGCIIGAVLMAILVFTGLVILGLMLSDSEPTDGSQNPPITQEQNAGTPTPPSTLNPQNSLLQEVYTLLIQDRLAQAQEKAQEAVQAEESAESQALLGIVLMEQYWKNRSESVRAEAEAAVRKAQQIDSETALSLTAQGNLYLAEKDFARGEAHFKRAIEKDTSLAYAHSQLGFALVEQRRYDEAESSLQTAVQLDSRLVQAHYLLGALYNSQQRWSEAESSLRAATQLDPQNGQYHAALAVALAGQGRTEEARAEAEQARSLGSSDPALQELLQ
jgi:Flp pilus assembly protein TadD